VVLDNINTVEKSDDGSDDADAVAQQHCAVIQTQQRRVQNQVVESGGHERHDEEGVCQQPGHQQQLLRVGQQQTHTQHQVGGEAHPVHREGGLVESLRGARGKPGPEVVTVEAEHGEEGNRDRDPVDGDDEDAVCPGGQAAAHGAGAQGHRSSI